jgi:two-component system chemotaxis response regulator CheY
MKHVLNVGQCGFDHGSISRFLESHFEVEVTAATTSAGAIGLLRQQPFDLVLVNRQFDADGTEGLDFVKALKADTALATKPVMLVTNFPEYDTQAVALGAVSGFGKAQVGTPDVVRKLEPFLK